MQYSLFARMEEQNGIVDNSVDNVKNSLQFRRDFHGSAMQNREQIMNIPMNNRKIGDVMGTTTVICRTGCSKIQRKETEYFYRSALDGKVPKE